VGYGGAVYADSAKYIEVNNSNFTQNVVALVETRTSGRAHGAAVFADATVLKFKLCSFTGQSNINAGGSDANAYGAVHVDDTRVTLDTCIFLNNLANRGLVSEVSSAYV
jgi:hypothetical protein